MRKLFSLFVALLAATSLWAYDFQAGDLYYNITSSSAPYFVEVTYKSPRSNYSNATLTIPAQVENNGITYAVTGIGNSAFLNAKSLISVSIPSSVINIEGNSFSGTPLYKEESNWTGGVLYIDNCLIAAQSTISGAYNIKEGTRVIAGNAFRACTSLTTINIPNSVVSIGSGAFNFCSALTSITIPNSVTCIGDYTFNECTSLSSLTLPNTITSIGEFAFRNCSTLVSFEIPYSVKSIGKAAFMECRNLTSSITIPEGVTCISDSAFYLCTQIPSITLPPTVTQIGNHAFYDCFSLTSINIPKNVTTIGEYAFHFCSPISIVVENGNMYYDSRNNCNAIIETANNKLIKGCCNSTIPNTVTTITSMAFASEACPTSIIIPKSVINIEHLAFWSCYSLSSVVVESGNPRYDSRDNCNAIIETPTNTLIKGCHNTIIPNTVTNIGDYAFDHCSQLISITIPNSVTNVGNQAFYFCTSLKSVVIPDNVTSIGNSAFYYCLALQSLTIGSGVQTFGWNAFDYCYDLKTVICKLVKVPTESEAYYGIYFTGTAHADATLYVPMESLEDYKSTYPWNKFGTILPLNQAPNGVENLTSLDNNKEPQVKTIRNGQLIILRDGVEYNAMGQEL